MLDKFIVLNRDEIIARTRARVMARTLPKPCDLELTNGIPVFLDQLGEALRRALSSVGVNHEEIGKSASDHGHDLLRMGLTVGQVVHDYGDICQVVTGLAIEQKTAISNDEFRTLNMCLDDAIAEAVTAYSRLRERRITDEENERLGILAHELRNLIQAALLSFDLIKSGRVTSSGSTGMILSRSLIGLRELVDRELAEVRLNAGIERKELIGVAQLVEEIAIAASLHAQVSDVNFEVTSVDPTVTIEGDRPIVAAAIANMLQNAFKFTCKKGVVSLRASATADRVLFEVEDECGGLPPGKSAELFASFTQRSADRSGLGLGLTICARAAQANGGEIYVRDLPGKGCVFTLDLPRKPPPPPALVVDDDAGENLADPQSDKGTAVAPLRMIKQPIAQGVAGLRSDTA